MFLLLAVIISIMVNVTTAYNGIQSYGYIWEMMLPFISVCKKVNPIL